MIRILSLFFLLLLSPAFCQNQTSGNVTSNVPGNVTMNVTSPVDGNVTMGGGSMDGNGTDYVIDMEDEDSAATGVPGNGSSNIFDHGDNEADYNGTEHLQSDSEDTMPTNGTNVTDGGNLTSSYKGFETSGELVVAVNQWMSNQSASVAASYGDISVWNVSLVNDMAGLFQGYEFFNGDISSWDVGNVMDISRMFLNARSFNQDLRSWNTRKVTSMASTFEGATSFSQDISAWNTSQVTTMADMFRGASSFNEDLSYWNTKNVVDISTMFWEATSFNVDISNWNVMNVRDFSSAFLNASSFGQQLCWAMREKKIVLRMFCGTNGASIRSDCVCEQDLYYEDDCIRTSTIEEMSCNPPSLSPSGAVSTSLVFGAIISALGILVHF